MSSFIIRLFFSLGFLGKLKTYFFGAGFFLFFVYLFLGWFFFLLFGKNASIMGGKKLIIIQFKQNVKKTHMLQRMKWLPWQRLCSLFSKRFCVVLQ